MFEKIPLEQFRKQKKQLLYIDELISRISKDTNYNYEDIVKFEKLYLELQNNLLSYDLSNIPFAEWENIIIKKHKNHTVDFSNTNANIDFKLIDYSPDINYKSCNIQNIEATQAILNPDHFDSNVVKDNPSLFLLGDFPSEIKEKIYNKNLDEACFLLSASQFEQVQGIIDNKINNLINILGIEKSKELYKYLKEDYELIKFTLPIILINEPMDEIKEKLQSIDISKLKSIMYEYIRKDIFREHLNNKNLNIEKLPVLFVQENKDILLIDENIPDDLRQRYYTGALTLDDISKNISLFKNIPISKISNKNISDIANSLGQESFIKFMEMSPKMFKYISENNLTAKLCEFIYNNKLYDSKIQTINFLIPFLSGVVLENNLLTEKLINYFKLFGEKKGVQLLFNRTETVKYMLEDNQLELMKSWYDKTGGKFIPDFVIMKNFRLDQADKFLSSGANWSNLMKQKQYANNPDFREAVLKLAYSFGVFDQDSKALKKVKNLITTLPKKIPVSQAYILSQIDKEIDLYSNRNIFFQLSLKTYLNSDNNIIHKIEPLTESQLDENYHKMIEYIKVHVNRGWGGGIFNSENLVHLFESLRKEKLGIDFSKSILTQIYKRNKDGTYTLNINEQNCPETTQIIRSALSQYIMLPIITPYKAYKLFGGFELKYDVDFREFLISNIDKIINNPEYTNLLPIIQRQFFNIKTINSNRKLTLELALNYVKQNKYSPINTGNERVAEIASIAGYSQLEFNVLQQIYNYGKQRTFSSIPKIEQTVQKQSGKYSYEILRLDDPLALTIGILTGCCQQLNDCAETCMEHSMIDKNGRVFVVNDEKGNVVAQSWVWRNKDVLCFDNIEIPNRAFTRAYKEYPELGREGLTYEIFELYKQASKQLIEQDEKVYKKLLENGTITQEQYDGLRLGKVTVGLGANDIASTLEEYGEIDKGNVTRPLPFEQLVKLENNVFYTKDSVIQYILAEREDRKSYKGDTLLVHSDSFIEYNDSNFKSKYLETLEKLEIVTKEKGIDSDTESNYDKYSEHIVTDIAKKYNLNPETTRIVMNPNFAIIYDVNDNKVKIGDLFFNTRIDNEMQQINIEKQVVMQMKLALDQIASNNEIDIENLNQKQKEMYSKIKKLTNEIDIERGVIRARK